MQCYISFRGIMERFDICMPYEVLLLTSLVPTWRPAHLWQCYPCIPSAALHIPVTVFIAVICVS